MNSKPTTKRQTSLHHYSMPISKDFNDEMPAPNLPDANDFFAASLMTADTNPDLSDPDYTKSRIKRRGAVRRRTNTREQPTGQRPHRSSREEGVSGPSSGSSSSCGRTANDQSDAVHLLKASFFTTTEIVGPHSARVAASGAIPVPQRASSFRANGKDWKKHRRHDEDLEAELSEAQAEPSDDEADTDSEWVRPQPCRLDTTPRRTPLVMTSEELARTESIRVVIASCADELDGDAGPERKREERLDVASDDVPQTDGTYGDENPGVDGLPTDSDRGNPAPGAQHFIRQETPDISSQRSLVLEDTDDSHDTGKRDHNSESDTDTQTGWSTSELYLGAGVLTAVGLAAYGYSRYRRE